MKLTPITLWRVCKYHMRYSRILKREQAGIENRYAWDNVVRANVSTETVPYAAFEDRLRRTVRTEWTAINEARMREIVSEAPQVSVSTALERAGNIEDTANLAFLLAMCSQPLRSIIDMRSLNGYYWIKIPRLPDRVVAESLDFFFDTEQYEKGLRLAERMKRYDVAVHEGKNCDAKAFMLDCLHLDGRTEEALELALEYGGPAFAKRWLENNLEMRRARKLSRKLSKAI